MSRPESHHEQPAEGADAPATPPAPGPAEGGDLSGRLRGLSLPRQVYLLAIWPFFEQLLNSLVGFVDTALAGRLGVAAANAVAITGYLGWLIGILMMAVGIGSTALIARAIGGGHRRLAHAAVGQSILIALAWGACLGIALFLAAQPLGRFFQLRPDALELCTLYLRILAPAIPFAGVLFVGNACLRGAGDTRSPFFAMLLVNLVNVAASVTFVYAPAPLGGHGVAGIAAGTSLAWVVGAALVLRILLANRGGIRLHLHRLRPHMHTARRIVRVGIPNLLESSGMWIGNALIARIVGGLQEEAALGALIIAIRVESLSFLPALALGTAAATLTGQYLGARNPRRAQQAVMLCWGVAAAFMAGAGLLFMIFPEPLARLLAPDEPDLYQLAAPLILIAGPVQIFFGTYMVLSHALRGAGDTTTAMILTYATTFLVRLPAAWIIAVPLGYGLIGVWIALCAELVVRGLVFMARFLQGGWKQVEV